MDALEGVEIASPVQPAMTAQNCGATGQAAMVLELAPLGASDESPVDAQAVAEDGCDGSTLNTCCEEEVVIVPEVSCNLSDGEQPAPCSPIPDTATCCSRPEKKGEKKSIRAKVLLREDPQALSMHPASTGHRPRAYLRSVWLSLSMMIRAEVTVQVSVVLSH